MTGKIWIFAMAIGLLFVAAMPGWASQEVMLSDGTMVILNEHEVEAVLNQAGMEYSEVAAPLPGGGYLVGSEEDFLGALEAIRTPTPPIFRTLSVTKTGTGQGTVTSMPKGIDCGPDCKEQSYDFRLNTNVTLIPKPAVGSIFGGWWTTSCSGLKPCRVKMDNDKSMQASFMLGTPDIAMTPVLPNNEKHFGNTRKGTTKSALFTIKNKGKGFLNIGQIVSTQSGQYEVPPEKDACSNVSLAPNKPCNFKIYFKPAGGGACGCAGRVEIPSDDPDSPTLSVTLCGCPT